MLTDKEGCWVTNTSFKLLKLTSITTEQKAIVEAQDAKVAEHQAKREADLLSKIERLKALADEAERVAEQMTQLRQKAQQIEAEKELLLAA